MSGEQEIVVYDAHRASADLAVADAGAARTDQLIVQMWLAGKSAKTQRAYAADARRLFKFMGKPLAGTRLEDLQAFAANLQTQGLADESRRRTLAAVKSLFSFASSEGIGHLRYNVAAAIRLPKPKDTLSQRILTEEQVNKLIAAAAPGRNRMIVELFYLVGMREEELTTLCWRDAIAAGDGGIMTLFGKGQKTRHVRLERDAWRMLCARRGNAGDSEPVFKSRNGGKLSEVQVWRIVSQAASRAGIKAAPHWLRHSHATHAIDHGCDIRTLQKSLGHASIETTERYVHSRPKQSSGAFVKRAAKEQTS